MSTIAVLWLATSCALTRFQVESSDRVPEFLRRLQNDSNTERARAEQDLKAVGLPALPQVLKACESANSELSLRAKRIARSVVHESEQAHRRSMADNMIGSHPAEVQQRIRDFLTRLKNGTSEERSNTIQLLFKEAIAEGGDSPKKASDRTDLPRLHSFSRE